MPSTYPTTADNFDVDHAGDTGLIQPTVDTALDALNKIEADLIEARGPDASVTAALNGLRELAAAAATAEALEAAVTAISGTIAGLTESAGTNVFIPNVTPGWTLDPGWSDGGGGDPVYGLRVYRSGAVMSITGYPTRTGGTIGPDSTRTLLTFPAEFLGGAYVSVPALDSAARFNATVTVADDGDGLGRIMLGVILGGVAIVDGQGMQLNHHWIINPHYQI